MREVLKELTEVLIEKKDVLREGCVEGAGTFEALLEAWRLQVE